MVWNYVIFFLVFYIPVALIAISLFHLEIFVKKPFVKPDNLSEVDQLISDLYTEYLSVQLAARIMFLIASIAVCTCWCILYRTLM